MPRVNRISGRSPVVKASGRDRAPRAGRRGRPGLAVALGLALGLASGCGSPAPEPVPGPGHAPRLMGGERFLVGIGATQAVLQNADFEIDAWLDDLERHGIRAAGVWSFMAVRQHADGSSMDPRWGYVVPDVTPWRRRDDGPLAVDGKPLWDLGAFDEEIYWPRLEHLVEETARRGIALWITVFDGWLKDLPAHPFLRANGGPLTSKGHFVALDDYEEEVTGPFDPGWSWQRQNQWLQERFAARLARSVAGREHVVLEIFNEGEWYDPGLALEHQRHFLRFFERRAAAPLAMNADHLWSSDAWSEPLVDIVSWHTSLGYDSRAAQRRWLDGYVRVPPKPVVNSETVPAFEGAGTGEVTEDDVRGLVWATLTAGGHILVQDDSAFAFAPRAPRRGGEAMRRQVGVAARLFAGLRPEEFAPAPKCASSGHCLAAADGRLVVYAPLGGTVAVRSAAGLEHAVACLDPRSGNRHDLGALRADRDGLGVRCPFEGDAVVLVGAFGSKDPPVLGEGPTRSPP